MIEGVVSVFAELILSLFAAAFEVAVMVLVESIRPWRYLVSMKFRQRIDADFAQRHPAVKVFFLAWGTVVILASACIVGAGVWAYAEFRAAQVSQQQKLLELAKHKAAGAIKQQEHLSGK